MTEKWKEELFECAEGLYILDEQSKKVLWVNDYFARKVGADCIGKPCWEVLLRREKPCPFCPRLKEGDGIYEWEHFEPIKKQWLKIKNRVFQEDGVLYRAGNVNMISDMMELNYEAVRELSELRKVLADTQGELEHLTKEAIYDVLTGLFNRNCFEKDLQDVYGDVTSMGILYLDLNNLKEINDQYHHTAGDMLLKRVGAVLRRISRHMKDARCYRIGGDEFALLAQCTEEEMNRCEELFDIYLDAYNQGEAHACEVAVGKVFSYEAKDKEQLVAKADKEMYRRKQEMKKKLERTFSE